MNYNIGIISNKYKKNIIKQLPNNTYIYCYINNKTDLEYVIDFLKGNNCKALVCTNKNILSRIRDLIIIDKISKIKPQKKEKKIILYNFTKKIINDKNIIDSKKMNIYRKDKSPKETIGLIKKILKENEITIKEKQIKKNFQGVYSIRIEDENHQGTNGKGLSIHLAKASAYAEYMERLQSNMLNKKRFKLKKVDRENKIYKTLLNRATITYKKKFFELNDIYFYVDKALNIKTNKKEYIPINAINSFCHTNGLASGNSFEEAVNQAIFEILERYCYQELLHNNINVKNIDIKHYPINKKTSQLLNKIKRAGYKYYIKDCSLGKYPVVGFLLLNNTETKYTFTIASDYSFDIALTRCITEMLQGYKLKEINKKLIPRRDLQELDKRYKKNYISFNWVKCFNNNIGYLPSNFFCNDYININKLNFKNYLTTNKEILLELKLDIKENIYVIDYNKLGFNTYRVYIPYMTTVDSFDLDDLDINLNYNKLHSIYTNILSASKEDLNDFINIFLKVCKNIKYDELIKPSDLFHLTETTNYYKLDFTSLLFILLLITNRKKDLINHLKFKIENFELSEIKLLTYKIIINMIKNVKIYDVENKMIEKSIEEILDDPSHYLVKLDPSFKEKIETLTNKKS